MDDSHLTQDQKRILRNKATEAPFSGLYNSYKGEGMFNCAACGAELFDAKTKFDSGSGWPSFYKPYKEGAVKEILDESHGMIRTEVVCAKCGGHLGHVFTDGPKQETGLRYCINSLSLELKNDKHDTK